MQHYRLYFLRDNHVRRVVELQCESDQHAIETVNEHRNGLDMELWQQSRLVKRFEVGRAS
jgi:hypothetical protein